MKLPILTVAAAVVPLTAAWSFEAAWQYPLQVVDDVLNAGSGLRPQLSELASKAQDKFDADLSGLPIDVVNDAWRTLENVQPELVDQVLGGLPRPKVQRRPDSEWLYHVESAVTPNHTLRIKSPSELGLDDVTQYSGYLDVLDEDKHFFFMFFESRNDPLNDPLILWLNGGPGCSSMTGLLFELGPSSIAKGPSVVHNPYAWNSNASVLFLDQPVNVGNSYSSNNVATTRAAGKDVYSLLTLFFDKFPEYKALDFHIAGESYAGHYIPAFAREILEHEDRTFNLTSVLIGNGITDSLIQAKYYEGMACGEGGYPSVLTPEKCEYIHDRYPNCKRLTQVCYDYQSPLTCIPAALTCDSLMSPYIDTGLNVYDIREKCGNSSLCYEEEDWIDQYMNSKKVRDAIGSEVEEFVGCSNNVGFLFAAYGDHNRPFQGDVQFLLRSGLPVLIYAGDKDYICNWLGNYAWTHALEWVGQDKFVNTPLAPWEAYDGSTAGEVKSIDLFTFLRVYDAGHMVPYNQPVSALSMVNEWTANLRLGPF